MESRRGFIKYLFASLSAITAAILAGACGAKPDAESEPSPEWPPKDE